MNYVCSLSLFDSLNSDIATIAVIFYGPSNELVLWNILIFIISLEDDFLDKHGKSE